jgi:hypothetical protein
MPKFVVPFDNVATGAAADTYKTMAAIRVADTAGHRVRLRALHVGPADDAPVDKCLAIKISRVADVSAGGAGTSTAVTPAKKDVASTAALASAGKNYTVEPTTYETEALWQGAINSRGAISMVWSADDAPVVGQDALVGVLMAPRDAAAVTVSGSLEFEEF